MRSAQEAWHDGLPMGCVDADAALLMVATDRSCSRQEWFEGVLKASANNDSAASTA